VCLLHSLPVLLLFCIEPSTLKFKLFYHGTCRPAMQRPYPTPESVFLVCILECSCPCAEYTLQTSVLLRQKEGIKPKRKLCSHRQWPPLPAVETGLGRLMFHEPSRDNSLGLQNDLIHPDSEGCSVSRMGPEKWSGEQTGEDRLIATGVRGK
jgi:hypothetical protein